MYLQLLRDNFHIYSLKKCIMLSKHLLYITNLNKIILYKYIESFSTNKENNVLDKNLISTMLLHKQLPIDKQQRINKLFCFHSEPSNKQYQFFHYFFMLKSKFCILLPTYKTIYFMNIIIITAFNKYTITIKSILVYCRSIYIFEVWKNMSNSIWVIVVITCQIRERLRNTLIIHQTTQFIIFCKISYFNNQAINEVSIKCSYYFRSIIIIQKIMVPQEISSEDRKKPKNNEAEPNQEDLNPVEDDSKEEQDLSSKKRQRDWVQKDSKVSKVIINNRRQQKFIDFDSSGEGIFLYKPGVQLPSLFQYSNQTIRVIIASEYIKKYNPQILKRNIYGTDTYTSNSDCVCMAVHSGLINLNNFSSKRYEGIQLSFKVIKPKKNYNGSTKNGLTSRSIKGYIGNALKPDTYKNLTSLGEIQNLQKYASNMHIPIGKNRQRPKPKNISNVIPIPQTHIIFNMNNQPAYKYSVFNLADKGYQKNQFIVKKLDHQVLYLQTDKDQKYELAKNMENGIQETYQFSKVKDPLKCDNLYFSTNYAPLQPNMIQILFPALEWENITWGNQSINIKQKTITNICSFKYHRRNAK